jgi:hypothetical protein
MPAAARVDGDAGHAMLCGHSGELGRVREQRPRIRIAPRPHHPVHGDPGRPRPHRAHHLEIESLVRHVAAPGPRVVRLDHVDHRVHRIDAGLDLDEQRPALGHAGEDVGEPRNPLAVPDVEGAQLGQGLRCDGRVRAAEPLGGLVVEHDHLVVARQPHVDLDAVRALREREVDRRDRVLRRVARSAAVADQPDRGLRRRRLALGRARPAPRRQHRHQRQSSHLAHSVRAASSNGTSDQRSRERPLSSRTVS